VLQNVQNHFLDTEANRVLLADVPSDYKQWLLTQGDIDPYLRKALNG